MTADRPPAKPKYRRATGVDDADAQRWLLDQVANALWFPPDATAADRGAIVKSAIAMLESIAPGDGIEGMLAAQMIATHAASMESARRAMNDANAARTKPVDPLHRERSLRQSSRLMALFNRQIAALHAHRAEKQAEQRAAEWGDGAGRDWPPYRDPTPTSPSAEPKVEESRVRPGGFETRPYQNNMVSDITL